MNETTFEERLGYMVYTEQFAGNLEGVREHLEYLRELGVNYLHLMPLLESRQEIYWEHFGIWSCSSDGIFSGQVQQVGL